MRSGHENCGFSVRIARTGTYPDHVIARFVGPTWAHLGLTGPRWAPCWPHELCYLGMPPFIFISTNRSKLKFPSSLLRGSLTCIKGPGRSRWSVLENGDEFRMIVILCIPYHVMIWKIILTHWSLEKYFYIYTSDYIQQKALGFIVDVLLPSWSMDQFSLEVQRDLGRCRRLDRIVLASQKSL